MSDLAYIYLLQDGNDKGTDVYKIGRTVQKGGDSRKLQRLQSYSKETVIYNTWKVSESVLNDIENKIKISFKEKYSLVRGMEWFEGDVKQMKKDIDLIIEMTEEDEKTENVFIFITQGISLFPLMLGSKTKIMLISDDDEEEEDEEEDDDFDKKIKLPSLKHYIVDTENEFSLEEKKIIKDSGIKTLEDIIRSPLISKEYKAKCIDCYKYVSMRYENMGIEPFNGYSLIKIKDFLFHIRICYDREIKFSKSLGNKNSGDYKMINV